jgi:hypothetical protein
MCKKLIFVLIFLSFSGAVLWLSTKSSSPFFKNQEIVEEQNQEIVENSLKEKNEIDLVFEKLEQEMGIIFGQRVESNFDWTALSLDKFLVSAKSVSLENLSFNEKEKINLFFKNNGFNSSEPNSSTGPSGLVSGYKKDNLVCLAVIDEIGNIQESTYKATISCGFFDEIERNLAPEDEKTTEDEDKLALVKLFSQKYNKPEEDVNLTINKNTGIYATGGINFSGELAGAMWLAFKDDSGWKLIFDGNGTIPCSSVEPYDFPLDMVSECWDEETQKLIKL